MPTSPPALRVAGLRKSYGDVDVLHDVGFDVHHGEIFGLLGSNGAGKTTAVEIIQGLRRRDAGTISLFGLDPVTDADEIRHRHLVGAQLQTSALPDRIKVGEALQLFAALAGNLVDWRELRDRWELGPLERRAFGALSGGQRQRLFLALALVNQPRLVFLDELTQGLDAAARRQTWDLIEEVRAAGTTIVLVTHFMDEAERLCDRVGILHDGRLGYEGRPSDLVTAVGGTVRVSFRLDEPSRLDGMMRDPGVVGAHVLHGRAEVRCHAAACVPVIAELFERGLTPDDLVIQRPTLEDAFVALTNPTTPRRPVPIPSGALAESVLS
jgi:ABC-2 type transport system ATP-binding protein